MLHIFRAGLSRACKDNRSNEGMMPVFPLDGVVLHVHYAFADNQALNTPGHDALAVNMIERYGSTILLSSTPIPPTSARPSCPGES